MTPLDLVLAGAAVAIGATIQGSIGFGLNVVAAPVLVLIDTEFVPGPALVAAVVLTILVGHRERASIDRSGFGWVFVGRVPGTVAGAYAVAALPEAGLAIALAALVLFAVVLSVAGWRVQRTPTTLIGAGALSGVMGTVSSVGGPPVALLYADEPGSRVRGTLSAIFMIGASFSILLLALFGEFGTDQVTASLVLMPAVVVGFLASRWTGRLLDRGFVRPAVLIVSAAAAIGAIARYAL